MQHAVENLRELFVVQAQLSGMRKRLAQDHVLLRGLGDFRAQRPGVLQGVSKRDKIYKLEAGRSRMLIMPTAFYKAVLDVHDFPKGWITYNWNKWTMDDIKRGKLAVFIGTKENPKQGIMIQFQKAFDLLDLVDRKIADYKKGRNFGLALAVFADEHGGDVEQQPDGSWRVTVRPSDPEQNPRGLASDDVSGVRLPESAGPS